MGQKLWRKDGAPDVQDDQIESFTVGNDHIVDRHIFADDCRATIAHAAALAQAGVLGAPELERLQHALLDLIHRHEQYGTVIERTQEDCHTAIEAALIEELGDLGKKIHAGRSRNDQVLTAIRLFTKRRVLDLSAALHGLLLELLDRARDGLRTPMRGYSHTRPAMPTTVAVWLGGFAELLLDDFQTLRSAYDLNDRSPLGSAAGYGSSIPLDRGIAQSLLGFADLQVNALACQNSRGKVEGKVLDALANIQRTVAMLARDMILYSSDEFGFLSLPDDLTTGSSIMPQKRNPDVLELVRGKTGVVVAAAAHIHETSGGLTSGYHRDYQLLKEPLINALATVEECLQVMARAVRDVSLHESALEASCTKEIYAADIATQKAVEGIPFRDAYRKAMAEIHELDIDAKYVYSRIDTYKTIGSMGNPALDRYEPRFSAMGEWLLSERESIGQMESRLKGDLLTCPKPEPEPEPRSR